MDFDRLHVSEYLTRVNDSEHGMQVYYPTEGYAIFVDGERVDYIELSYRGLTNPWVFLVSERGNSEYEGEITSSATEFQVCWVLYTPIA